MMFESLRLFVCIIVFLSIVDAYNVPKAPHSGVQTQITRISRGVTQVLTSVASVALLQHIEPAYAIPKAATPEEYQAALNDIFLASEVIKPVKKFVDMQSYDKARSNVKYTLDQLGLQKKVTTLIQNSIDYVDDPEVIDAATDAAANVANTAIQLDGSIYTCVFIPGDDMGGIAPNAEKYRKEAFEYINKFNRELDVLKTLGTSEQQNVARNYATGKLGSLPSNLFPK